MQFGKDFFVCTYNNHRLIVHYISLSRHPGETPETPRTSHDRMVIRGIRGASIGFPLCRKPTRNEKKANKNFEKISQCMAKAAAIVPRIVKSLKYFWNFFKSTQIYIIFILFRLIWIQMKVYLDPNQSENGKYNLISIWFNAIWKRFLIWQKRQQCSPVLWRHNGDTMALLCRDTRVIGSGLCSIVTGHGQVRWAGFFHTPDKLEKNISR